MAAENETPATEKRTGAVGQPPLDQRTAARVGDLERKIEALTMALAMCVPDSTQLVAALLAAPRAGWQAVLDAYAIGRANRNRGSGI